MRYFKQLDGLRFIAVFLVLIEHFATFAGQHFSAGYYGVDLFFVISGFLITTILIRSNEPFGKAYKKFIGRRTIRIFPIYYLTILSLYIIGNKDVQQWMVYCITYTYNYAWTYFNIQVNPISHFWSLGVEEQFYLFWPFIILGLRKRTTLLKYVIWLLVVTCGVQLYFHVFKTLAFSGLGLIPQAYALGIGALGAV
jgi:peptidoglycan/LPS O-acetylase OafA/YrhL